MAASVPATVSVVFASNDFYVPYLSALFASILKNRNKERALELIVLSEDITDQHVAMLEKQVQSDNVSLRMLNVSEAMHPYEDKLKVRGHFKLETYFRLLLPQLLPNHHKVLYLDADMICLRDVTDLFDTNVDGYLLAACKDPDTTGIYNGVDIDLEQPNKKDYMDNILCIKNPYEYFQAGTIVFNLDEWRASIDVNEVFAFAQSRQWQLLDQDVLNYFCQGRVKFVDMAWNVMYDYNDIRIKHIISKTTPELRQDYMNARKDPYIVHYAGPIKPWNDPECDFAYHFWDYARTTPFYEVTVGRMTRTQLEQLSDELKATNEFLKTVDAELQRYEHRSLGLMLKEFVYQKLLTPIVERATSNNEGSRQKVQQLYYRVHPNAKRPTSN